MTSCDPHRYCEAVRSAILATAWLVVPFGFTSRTRVAFVDVFITGLTDPTTEVFKSRHNHVTEHIPENKSANKSDTNKSKQ